MLTFNPDTPEPVSTTTLMALLADPKSAQKYLTDIKTHTENLKKQTEAHLSSISELQASKDALDATQEIANVSAAEANKAYEAAQNLVANKEADFNDREAALASDRSEFNAKHKDFMSFHDQKMADLQSRETAVMTRENEVTKKENDLRVLSDQAQSLKSFYEVKMSNLRDALRTDYVLHAGTGHIGANT